MNLINISHILIGCLKSNGNAMYSQLKECQVGKSNDELFKIKR